ncbi:protein-methionine-sulfoxide reductase heme-binding subunit MsrQ [Shewanella sp.]|uniref:protein-methionine-sulfoxide reductase heme-binding subunit MsrQ n=1 Tax=Shewanella sp. TaxID=50422 RepID=UPI00356257E8
MRLGSSGLMLLKILLHLGFSVPLLWLVWGVLSERLGGDPVQYLIHYTGKGALHGLMITLLVSPMARWLKLGALMQCRRLLGLWAFVYAVIHLMLFLSLDLLFEWRLLVAEVIKRPYLVVGMTALLILLALAVSSPNRVRRKLGHSWQRLHNLIYVAALLVPVHYLWSVKSEILEPTFYILICVWLMWLRRDKLKKLLSRPLNSGA